VIDDEMQAFAPTLDARVTTIARNNLVHVEDVKDDKVVAAPGLAESRRLRRILRCRQ
jgi:hypothetical protein